MKKESRSLQVLALTAILCLSLGSAGTSAITPIIANIIEAFPNVPTSTIYLISTLPSLICLGSAVLFGPFIGHKIGYRTTALIGTAICCVGGLAPVFLYENVYIIIVSRAIMGFGMGMMNHYQAYIIACYPERSQQAKYVGFATVINKIGAIIMLQGAGWLARINWHTAFWVYGVLAIVFVIEFLFMREPEVSLLAKGNEEKRAAAAASSEKKAPAKKEKLVISGNALFWCVWWFIVLLMQYPVILTLSQVVLDRGIGDSVTSANLNTIYQIGGMIGSAVFGVMFAKLKRWFIPVMLVPLALGMVLHATSAGFAVSAVGLFIMGFTFTVLALPISVYQGASCPANSMSFVQSIFNVGVRLAIVVSGYYIPVAAAITGNQLYGSIWIGIGVYVVLFIVMSLHDFRPKQLKEAEKAGK